MRHAVVMGKKFLRGSEHGRAVLTEDIVRFIRGSSVAPNELARLYGVTSTAIRLAINGKNWKHVK